MIEYNWRPPAPSDYKHLMETVGWRSMISASDEMLRRAIDNSWKWVSAFEYHRLVGLGRIISDGALYALVCDMIVLPEYQNHGLGSTIIKMLKDKCVENHIQRIWLFAAAGRSAFYQKNGFEIRPADAPGMQMQKR